MDCIDKIEFVALDFLSLFDKGTRFDHSHHFLPGFNANMNHSFQAEHVELIDFETC